MVNRPADPWNGNPAYHTVDFLKLAKARLSGNGLVLTRVDTRWLDRRDIGKLMRSYGAVFSYVQIWAMDYRDIYLLASDRPLAPPFPSFIQGLAGDTPISQFVRNYRIGQIPYDLIRLFRANAWEVPETGESSSTLRDANLNWSGSLKFHSLDNPEKERYGLRMFLDLPETRLAIASMGVPRGEELVLPMLGLAARIQKGWRVSFVGMRFLPTPESDARDVTPMFEIASTDNKHQIGAWPHYLSTPSTPTLQDIVTEVSRGEMITTGEGGINRHPMRWSLTSNDGGFEFTGAWYCQPLNSYFVTRYRDESSEKSDWDAMRKSLLSQITCLHPPPSEAS